MLLRSCICFEKYDFYREQCPFHVILDVEDCLTYQREISSVFFWFNSFQRLLVQRMVFLAIKFGPQNSQPTYLFRASSCLRPVSDTDIIKYSQFFIKCYANIFHFKYRISICHNVMEQRFLNYSFVRYFCRIMLPRTRWVFTIFWKNFFAQQKTNNY